MPIEGLNNEPELLRRIAEGDQLSFRILVDAYWPRVYGSTLALTKRTETAEELTQDIFLKIWNQRERLASVENFAVYIYVVGRNQVIAALRKKIKNSADLPQDTVADMLLPDMQLEMKEMHLHILEGIEKLPTVRKKVFKMNRLEGLSYEDIATELEISRNTVKDHMVLALNYLRNHMHEWTKILLFILLLSLLACKFDSFVLLLKIALL